MNKNMIIVNQATMKEVRAIPVPETTDTFFPTPHAEVITMVESFAKGLLDDSFTFKKNVYGLARKGQRLFGMLTFANSDDEQELAIAYRQGYDKTLPYGVALGTSVMICANLDLSGDIVMAKKHTRNGWDAIKSTTELALKNAPTIYHKHIQDADDMKQVKITQERGWQLLGFLRGSNILKPVQLSKAFEQWAKSDYDHPTDNLWGLFNSCTEALKLESDPTSAMSRRLALHNVFTEKFVPYHGAIGELVAHGGQA